MKKIAFILILIFSFVQAAPAVSSLLSIASSVFMVDEEKSEDKTELEKKEKKKDYPAFASVENDFSNVINIAFNLAENIYPFPCIEKVSPPPNYC